MKEVEKKRPVIAARQKGPGPGRYGLPPTIGFIGHDFTKPTSPAYSFHGATKNIYAVDSSPGPQYSVDAKITRFGKEGTPAYSIFGKIKERKGVFNTPGPGTYSPEKTPPCSLQSRAPSYTMGSRTNYRPVDAVPPPNMYTLPPLLGSKVPNKTSSASYTISGVRSRGQAQDISKTPGPCGYNSTDPNVYLTKQPAFSMLGRHSLDRDNKGPGPATYHPEKVTVHKSRTPAFSMGIRHSEYIAPLIVDVADCTPTTRTSNYRSTIS
ncbi:outer dense fiber protein 3-like protein 2b [Thalassophryne amazonica]|uniref:outer dense fiber protein 3-like protein 2b n=1 Tax=Thalassophryne amazonica TaxID=390379 RepID=UPI001471492C|nr:outer dense fiber protein 3-like protein 2b [Thalassophryne amazonica]